MATPFEQALTLAAMGGLDSDQLEAINTVQQTGSLIPVCPVMDANGNPLNTETVYRFRDELIKITEWKFGSGNMMDTYYWVWFIRSSDLSTGRVTVGAKYLGQGQGRIYQTPFVPK